MRNDLLAVLVVAFIVLPLNGVSADDETDFTVCKSTYALCTTASCIRVAGTKDTVACSCEVKIGYSLGSESCQDPDQTSSGSIKSRYFPVKSYAVCRNNRPWAWCLDKPCTVDKDDPTKASCTCTSVKDKGPYVIVTDSYTDKTCTTGIISSATVAQVTQVTDFLKKSTKLKPFNIEVLTGSR